MRLWFTMLLAAFIFCGCTEKKPNRTTPKGAFARLANCVDHQDTKCLFHELDGESRWAFVSIFHTLHSAAQTVAHTFPANARQQNLFGFWQPMANATDYISMFDQFCRQKRCLAALSEGFGTVQQTKPIGDNKVILTTIRGKSFTMVKTNNHWGLATYRDFFKKEVGRLGDVKAQIARNAYAYGEQRLATKGTEPSP